MTTSKPIMSAHNGLHALARLQGDWRLSREIRHADGQIDRFHGVCRFARSGPRLIQDESGTLETKDGRFEATRRYVWTETEGWLHVHFADMRPFVSIPVGVARPETTHLCPPDRYAVVFDFSIWPDWESVWTVEGPRKSYVMRNRFSPMPGD